METTRPPVYNVGFDYLPRGLRLGLGLGYTVHIADGPVTGVHNDFNATESGVRTDSGVQPNLCKLFTIIEVCTIHLYYSVYWAVSPRRCSPPPQFRSVPYSKSNLPSYYRAFPNCHPNPSKIIITAKYRTQPSGH